VSSKQWAVSSKQKPAKPAAIECMVRRCFLYRSLCILLIPTFVPLALTAHCSPLTVFTAFSRDPMLAP
jgi:hypothetical protein